VKTSEGPAMEEESCERDPVFLFSRNSCLFVAKLAIHPYEEKHGRRKKMVIIPRKI
jgi:hypothetical protein